MGNEFRIIRGRMMLSIGVIRNLILCNTDASAAGLSLILQRFIHSGHYTESYEMQRSFIFRLGVVLGYRG